jgi:hypothetical protein
MDSNAQKEVKISPWLQIWLRPGHVLGHLVARRDTQYMNRIMVVWSVACMAAVMLPSWLDPSQPHNPLEPLIQVLVIAPFAGLIAGYTAGGALKSVAGWFGGQSTSDVMRMVHAWSLVPAILSRFIGMIAYVALRPEGNAMWIVYGIWIGGFVWSAIVRHAGLQAAFRSSKVSAVVVHLIAYLMMLLPLAFIIVIYFLVLKTALRIQ